MSKADDLSKQERPIGILLCQGALMLGIMLTPFFDGYRPPAIPNGLLEWLASAAFLAGAVFVLAAAKTLKKTFTVETAVKPDTKLSADFPFNISRNPMYAGGLLMCLAWSLLQRSKTAFVMTVLLAWVLNEKIKIEERNLTRVFGEEYERYRRQVRRFI